MTLTLTDLTDLTDLTMHSSFCCCHDCLPPVEDEDEGIEIDWNATIAAIQPGY